MLFGLALSAKPPAVCFAPLLVVELLRGASHTRARTLGAAFAGALLSFGALPAYVAMKGGGGAMWDVLVGANRWFASHGRLATSPVEVARATYRAIDWFAPFSYAGPIACVLGLVRARRTSPLDASARARWTEPLVLVALGYASVFVQGKFFVYHYGVMVLPFAAVFAEVHAEVAAWLAARRANASARPVFVTSAYVALAIVICLATTGFGWLTRAMNAARYATGGISDDALTDAFTYRGYIDMHAMMRTTAWLREHTAPEDNVLVRGYDPEIYTYANRRYRGRFFWTAALTDPGRAYRREAWLREDEDAIRDTPPRYVVAYEHADSAIDSVAWFSAKGYRARESFGPFTVLEAPPPSP
jgi:hypothetical protein